MYIPITKNEEKCAGQLSYGLNIQDKLEGGTHEKILIILDKTIFPEGDSHLKLSFIVAAGPFLFSSLKPLWYLRKWERRS